MDHLADRISYVKYKSKKSTWSEIKTVIHALESLQNNPEQLDPKIVIYTDCQSVCDLLGRRKEKLKKNNFVTANGSVLNNAELYKELYALSDKYQANVFKVKGHQAKINTKMWYDKIFTILDKLSRKKLRLELQNL